ncbi:unnamed protein product [Notodromas monacha]|uniref:arginyltransferase n=1 Tax=Notodromas monacha TaxID=399045 RepID=A0A7R9BLZ5_9CRUS|nr:unnamed protein product [Notodromas monacha]CAG0917671.1 unnamed protein product [Notodromas monacha]
MSTRSVVINVSEDIPEECGYCRSSGVVADVLTCDDYQALIDRGWRRSGKYCYKPRMDKTCCPLYTIRCEAENFVPSKSQKKLLKKVGKFVTDGARDEVSDETKTEEKLVRKELPVHPRKGDGADPLKPPCRKAKLMRLEKKMEKSGNILCGSFHQQYWLDDRLICVGVIDVLPNCVSSVYTYYDPDFRSLTLGTYSALREIAFTRELMRINPKLCYYYMGYYVHTCQKMRYKSQFSPSFLLCPETYRWCPISDCLPKLDFSKYSRLSDAAENPEDTIDIKEKVMVLFCGRCMTYGSYCSNYLRLYNTEPDDFREVAEYARLVGPICSRILLYRRAQPPSLDDSS